MTSNVFGQSEESVATDGFPVDEQSKESYITGAQLAGILAAPSAGVGSRDHERDEAQARPVNRTGNFPASLGREDDAGCLEALRSVSIRYLRADGRRRRVETSAGNPELTRHHTPPAELHPDASEVVDEVRAGLDHAMWPEAADPEVAVAVRSSPAEQPLLRRSRRSVCWERHQARRSSAIVTGAAEPLDDAEGPTVEGMVRS